MYFQQQFALRKEISSCWLSIHNLKPSAKFSTSTICYPFLSLVQCDWSPSHSSWSSPSSLSTRSHWRVFPFFLFYSFLGNSLPPFLPLTIGLISNNVTVFPKPFLFQTKYTSLWVQVKCLIICGVTMYAWFRLPVVLLFCIHSQLNSYVYFSQ